MKNFLRHALLATTVVASSAAFADGQHGRALTKFLPTTDLPWQVGNRFNISPDGDYIAFSGNRQSYSGLELFSVRTSRLDRLKLNQPNRLVDTLGNGIYAYRNVHISYKARYIAFNGTQAMEPGSFLYTNDSAYLFDAHNGITTNISEVSGYDGQVTGISAAGDRVALADRYWERPTNQIRRINQIPGNANASIFSVLFDPTVRFAFFTSGTSFYFRDLNASTAELLPNFPSSTVHGIVNGGQDILLSSAAQLSPQDTDAIGDLYLYNRTSATLRLLTVGNFEGLGTAFGLQSPSPDGKSIYFQDYNTSTGATTGRYRYQFSTNSITKAPAHPILNARFANNNRFTDQSGYGNFGDLPDSLYADPLSALADGAGNDQGVALGTWSRDRQSITLLTGVRTNISSTLGLNIVQYSSKDGFIAPNQIAPVTTGLFYSGEVQVSNNGQVIAFITQSVLTAADTDFDYSHYVHNRETGTTTYLGEASAWPNGLIVSGIDVSGDGRFVFYSTRSVVPGVDPNNQVDIHRFEVATGNISLVTPGISAGGGYHLRPTSNFDGSRLLVWTTNSVLHAGNVGTSELQRNPLPVMINVDTLARTQLNPDPSNGGASDPTTAINNVNLRFRYIGLAEFLTNETVVYSTNHTVELNKDENDRSLTVAAGDHAYVLNLTTNLYTRVGRLANGQFPKSAVLRAVEPVNGILSFSTRVTSRLRGNRSDFGETSTQQYVYDLTSGRASEVPGLVAAISDHKNRCVFLGSLNDLNAYIGTYSIVSRPETFASPITQDSFVDAGKTLDFTISGADYDDAEGQLVYEARINEGEWMSVPSGTLTVAANQLRLGRNLLQVRARNTAGRFDLTPVERYIRRRN